MFFDSQKAKAESGKLPVLRSSSATEGGKAEKSCPGKLWLRLIAVKKNFIFSANARELHASRCKPDR
jgi:hypothetical protein